MGTEVVLRLCLWQMLKMGGAWALVITFLYVSYF
jgi:hypothetical protein